jgi:hypothetical protein
MKSWDRLRQQHQRLVRRIDALAHDARRANDDVERALAALGLSSPSTHHEVIDVQPDGMAARSWAQALRVVKRAALIGVGVVVLVIALWAVGVFVAMGLIAVVVFRQLGLRVELAPAASPT